MKQIIHWTSIAIAVCGFSVVLMFAAFAQEPNADEWLDPINLSQSGGASDPSMLIDGSGTYHFIWRDMFAGFVYSSGTPDNWNTPVASDFPFVERLFNTRSEVIGFEYHQPILVADSEDTIHAIWTTVDKTLLYSRVAATDVASIDDWIRPIQIAENALAFAAVADNTGQLHVTYVRSLDSEQFPAGVYFMQLANANSFEWSERRLLYESRYFRSTDAADTNLTIVSQFDELAIGWDDPIPEKVFVKTSNDRGETWSALIEVDGRQPADAADSERPSDIQLQLLGGVHAVWRAGHDGNSCSLWHQQSIDQGATWERNEVLDARFGCAEQFTLLADSKRRLWLLTETQDTIYLQLWENKQWGEPLEQSSLKRFNDPERFRPINLECQQALIDDQELVVVGCDSQLLERNETLNLDVWLLRKTIDDIESLFEPTPAPIWDAPVDVAQSVNSIGSPQLLTDFAGNMHALWVESDQSNSLANSIYYSRVENGRWILPARTFTANAGFIGQPSFALHNEDQLVATWSEGQDGVLYFSMVNLDSAPFVDEWKPPVRIAETVTNGNAPQIIVGNSGEIAIVYVVSINEERGVYLVTSDDNGTSWQPPSQIFDATLAGWEEVDDPQLVISADDTLHLTWARSGPTGYLSLHYATSADFGETWAQMRSILDDNFLESKLLSNLGQETHLFWREAQASQFVLWHKYSLDLGVSWQEPKGVLIANEVEDDFAVTSDKNGRIHVLNISAESGLQHMQWERSEWQTNRSERVITELFKQPEISLATSEDGLLAMLYAGSATDQNAIDKSELLYSERLINTSANSELASGELSTALVADSTPRPDKTTALVATITATPAPTPTLVFETSQNIPNGTQLPTILFGQWSGVLVSAGSALMLVVVVYAIALRSSRRRGG